MATTMRKLTKEEWTDVRDLASTVTGYEPDTSGIKGQTTIQIVQSAIGHINAGDTGDGLALLETLVKREAFNTFIGVESKKRRKN